MDFKSFVVIGTARWNVRLVVPRVFLNLVFSLYIIGIHLAGMRLLYIIIIITLMRTYKAQIQNL